MVSLLEELMLTTYALYPSIQSGYFSYDYPGQSIRQTTSLRPYVDWKVCRCSLLFSQHCLKRFQSRAVHLCQHSRYVRCFLPSNLSVTGLILFRYQNFAPSLHGRYMSSNVNITVLNEKGEAVSVPVGGESVFSRSFKIK